MKKHYRTIWISDVHLGSKGCQADRLLNFLKHTESEYLFLVGDIIDFWSLRRFPYWPSAHNTVVQKVLKKARNGTKVIFIPGNHDEALRDYLEYSFGDILLHEEYTHTLADGRKVHCLHGDIFDVVTRYHKWLAVLGDVGYTFLLWLNRHFNDLRKRLGMGFWSLSSYIKYRVKQAVNFIGNFEEGVVEYAREKGVNIILCGHIHHAEMKQYGDVLYLNDGDWVESCTSIVEHMDGTLELIRWNDEQTHTNSNRRLGTTDKRSGTNSSNND